MNSNSDVLRIAIKNELFGESDDDGKNNAKELFTKCLVNKIKINKINTELIKKSQNVGIIELGYSREEILEKLYKTVENEKVLVIYSDKIYDNLLEKKGLPDNVVDYIYIPIEANMIDIVESITSYNTKYIIIIDPILSLRASEIQLSMPDYNLTSFTEYITDDIILKIQSQ